MIIHQPPFAVTSEILHLVAEIGEVLGRMGRLWQSLILARWKPLFANLPVETLVFEKQKVYYAAIRESTKKTDSAPLCCIHVDANFARNR
jgi:hypothetical protein